MSAARLDLLALSLIPGLGDKSVKQLVSYCGSPENVFRLPKKKLESIPGFGPKIISQLQSSSTRNEAEEIIKAAESKGIEILSYLDPTYPQRLKMVIDSPVILYKRGKGNLNPARSLAVVGTRKATEYGKKATTKLIEDCAKLDTQIVSGLAYGIDIEAHRAALKNQLSTVAVLAGGLDWIYPSVHKKYAEEMLETGAIISESRPGTKPDPHLFPSRNRIIAGMTDATIVVEAAAKGGALITAKIADSYNRPLFAVPGNLENKYSEGTNHLICTQLALIYTGTKDLKYQLNWEDVSDNQPVREKTILEGSELLIYDLISSSGESLQIDHISIKSQLPINEVASVLLSLEFQGLIKNMPGKKYGLV